MVARMLIVGLLWLGLFACASTRGDESYPMRLRLKNGGFLGGRLVDSSQDGFVGWQNDNFHDPFNFDMRAIRTITTVTNGKDGLKDGTEPEAGLLFLLRNGSSVSGELLELDDRTATISSPTIGKFKIDRNVLQEMESSKFEGKLLYSGPRNLTSWIQQTKGSEWVFEAGALASTKAGQAILGNVGLPDKCQITTVLTWRGIPEFILSLGCDQDSKGDRGNSAARIECWNEQLALVREVENGADVNLLGSLSRDMARLELTVFLDQTAGKVAVYDPRGKSLGLIELPAKVNAVRSFVHLYNNGPQLRLERLEVRQWDGHLRVASSKVENQVVDQNGNVADAVLDSYDSATGIATVRDSQGRTSRLPLNAIRRAVFEQTPQSVKDSNDRAASDEPTAKRPPSTTDTAPTANANASAKESTNNAAPRVEQPPALDPEAKIRSQGKVVAGSGKALDQLVEVQLSDRTRLIGSWLHCKGGVVYFQAEGIDEPIRFEPGSVVEFVGSAEKFVAAAPADNGIVGRLQLSSAELLGSLVNSDQDGKPLRWQPEGSASAGAIKMSVSGAIVYRVPDPKRPVQAAANDPNRRAANVNIGIPANILIQRNANPAVPSSVPLFNTDRAKTPREIVLRSGDVITGYISGINEQGMHFQSETTKTTFLKHDQIQSAVLVPSAIGSMTPDKMTRLMTVPRLMRKDPPTHMVISLTGDYLRGRLVKMDENIVTMEIQLELYDIPRTHISQIVWLHDRDWTLDDQASENNVEKPVEEPVPEKREFLIHGLKARQQGISFQPLSFVNGTLKGVSELLGECEIRISEIEQLIFGLDVGSRVRDIKQQSWQLMLARMPKVYLNEETGEMVGAPMEGTLSPLVGKMAPDFTLVNLDGKPFKLSQNRDRIVILDFWASWCGPCMQTMPEIDRIVKAIGEDKIHLVAVNQGETPERAKATAERLGLSATVIMDTDGKVSNAYDANAIPQTVIIDKTGNISHLFVGGGPRFVEGFTAAIKEAAGIKEAKEENEPAGVKD